MNIPVNLALPIMKKLTELHHENCFLLCSFINIKLLDYEATVDTNFNIFSSSILYLLLSTYIMHKYSAQSIDTKSMCVTKCY